MFHGSSELGESVGDIALAPDDSIFVAGHTVQSVGPAGGWLAADIWAQELAPEGHPIWSDTYGAADPQADDRGNGIAVGPGGAVVMAGYVEGAADGSSLRAWVASILPDKTVAWTRTYDDVGSDRSEAAGLAVDTMGNVIVVGSTDNDASALKQGWVRKYDKSGDLTWTALYSSVAELPIVANAVATDAFGDVVVVGRENRDDVQQGDNVWVRKHLSNGDEVWKRTHDSSFGASFDNALAVTIDTQGNVIVVGSEQDVPGVTGQAWVRKLDSDGDTMWERTYDGEDAHFVEARDVATDAGNNIVVAGVEERFDRVVCWVRGYRPDGGEDWTWSHAGDQGYANANAVAVDSAGDVIVGGVVSSVDEPAQGYVMKLMAPARS